MPKIKVIPAKDTYQLCLYCHAMNLADAELKTLLHQSNRCWPQFQIASRYLTCETKLIYLSRNTILGSNENVHQEIEQILAISRQRNAVSGITGALMFNRECFAQVLEGVHDQIQETFERIQCDPRHGDVVVLDFEPVDTRRFSRWLMGYISYNTLASKEFT